MDSNTISFAMLRSSTHSITSPQMVDESLSFKSKSTEESTNLIDFEQFKKASTVSCSTADCDHESLSQPTHLPVKTKIIQKQTLAKKHSQKHSQNSQFNNTNQKTSKTSPNQNGHVNGKNKQHLKNQQKDQSRKPITVKSHTFVSIFDWMMQIAAIMKLTRTVFYRACNIFYETYKIDKRVVENVNVQRYTCACLLISAKLQTSTINYLQQLHLINRKFISIQLITQTEIKIYQTLNWKLPLHSLVSEQVMEVFQKWNHYLDKCEKMSLIRKDTKDRLNVGMKFEEGQALKNKTHGEILYVLDIMLLNQSKKYMNANKLPPMQDEFSTNQNQEPKDYQSFITPIVIAMYSVFTIQHGDTQNRQQFFLPLFKNFYREQLQRSAPQIDRLQKQIQLSFMVFNFASHISKIPLNKDWKQALAADIQIYLPVNVLKKVESQP